MTPQGMIRKGKGAGCSRIDPPAGGALVLALDWHRRNQGDGHGVFGRKAGAAPGFKRYSPAIKKSGVVWNAETLDKYLAKPRAFIKGNRMPFAGRKKKADRDNLIAYLEKAAKAK